MKRGNQFPLPAEVGISSSVPPPTPRPTGKEVGRGDKRSSGERKRRHSVKVKKNTGKCDLPIETSFFIFFSLFG